MAVNVVEVLIRARDEASRVVSNATKVMEGDLRALSRVGLVVGAVGTAIEGALLATSVVTARYGEELLRVSKVTGVTVEQLSRLKFAAEQSETSFEDLQMGLRFLTRNLGDAQNASSAQARAFAALGISTRDAQGSVRSAGDVLLDVADRMSRMGNATERGRIALELLGRSGTTILPFLTQGRDGIEQLLKQADTLGITFSTNAAVMSDKFNDSLHALQLTTAGVTHQIGTAMLPVLTGLVESLTPVISNISHWIEKNPELAGQLVGLVATLGGLAVTLGAVAAILPSVAAGIGLMTTQLKALPALIATLSTIAALLLTVSGVMAGFAAEANLQKKIDQFRQLGLITTDVAAKMAAQLLNGSEAEKEMVRTTLQGLGQLARARGLIKDEPLVSPQSKATVDAIRKSMQDLSIDLEAIFGKQAPTAANAWQQAIAALPVDAQQSLTNLANNWEAAAKSLYGSTGDAMSLVQAATETALYDIGIQAKNTYTEITNTAEDAAIVEAHAAEDSARMQLNAWVESQNQIQDKVLETEQQINAGLTSMMRQTLMVTSQGTDIFSQLWVAALNKVIEKTLEAIAVQQFLNSITGFLGGIVKGVFGFFGIHLQEGALFTKPTTTLATFAEKEPEGVFPLSKLEKMMSSRPSVSVYFTHYGTLMGNDLEATQFAREIMNKIRRESARR